MPRMMFPPPTTTAILGAPLAANDWRADHLRATLAPGATQAGLDAIVRDLYQYWKPGMELPSVEELMAQVPAAAEPAAAAPSGDAASGLDPRVPAHLWERSRLGRERWMAKQA